MLCTVNFCFTTNKGTSLSDPAALEIKIPAGDSGDGRFTNDCGHRVVNDRDPAYADVPRTEPSAFLQMLFEQGLEHEDEIFSLLERAHGVTRLSPDSGGDLGQQTTLAMHKGERLILGSQLSTVNGRSGRPDILVRVGDKKNAEGKWEYLPVDVKFHSALDGSAKPKEWNVGSIDDPWWESCILAEVGKGTPDKNDSLQLAHYWQMLSDLGHAGSTDPLGGIFDRDGILVWRQLDEPMWKHPDPNTQETKQRSALEIANLEWSFRWRAITIVLNQKPEQRLTEPILHGNCAQCTWSNVCYDELDEIHHVSLVAGVTLDNVHSLGGADIVTMEELAAVDLRTAQLMVGAKANNLDLAELVASAHAHSHPSAPVTVLTGKKKNGPAYLESVGITAVGDLLTLNSTALLIKPFTRLVSSIDGARVRLRGDGHPYSERNDPLSSLSRGDIEVDIDMENAEIVYLWGTYLTDHRDVTTTSALVQPGYRPFHTFDGLDEFEEGRQFILLWNWMHELIDWGRKNGNSVRFYCYTNAEENKMNELTTRHANLAGMPTLDQIQEFVTSEFWVDLKKTVDKFVWPTDGLGLKKVAPLAGFSWHSEDAGGDNSILWFEKAMNSADENERQEMRDRLLQYNEDDVVATLVVRDWLDDGLCGRTWTIESVTALDHLYA
jgi:hypothetical protein